VQYCDLKNGAWSIYRGQPLTGKPHIKHHPCNPVMDDQHASIILRKAAEKEKRKGEGQENTQVLNKSKWAALWTTCLTCAYTALLRPSWDHFKTACTWLN